MSDLDGNGSPVTWRELNLALQPLKDGHKRLEHKMDDIANTIAENRGADRANRGLLDSRRWLISTIIVVLTSSISLATFTLIIRSHG